MSERMPLVSAGIPVYQGENFLDETLRALRAQDYPNLEIVVCDNASTDRTADIVREHAAEDPRVRLIVNKENIGAAPNYNKAFEVSRGEYFAWNAHDDLSSSGFFRSGVEALRNDSDAVVAIPRSFRVDIEGNRLEEFHIPAEIHSARPHIRFRAAARAHPEAIVFGLFRSDAIKRTRLHGSFAGSDRNFVAELMLHGRAAMAADSEFYLREHPNRSVRTFHRSGKGRFTHMRDGWYAPERKGRMVFPNWRRLREYISSVTRTRLGFADAVLCYLAVARILTDDRFKLGKQLGYDLIAAGFFVARKLRGSDTAIEV
jgi:glycosyltransferase involved in cell wall biosynthesis